MCLQLLDTGYQMLVNRILTRRLAQNYFVYFTRLSTTEAGCDDEKQKEIERITKDASLDSPPTTCCQSGCSNCVFIIWAEALSKKIENATPEIAERIIKMVDDPNMKAYLEMELKLRGLKK